eukprot:TRINITY_DN10077_c0_g2_i1.p1 TRINITY_DN10077_c0_g2~~TRINITY_DN10077_c0_g2_i1.p1  ORF type:complete len:165 (-),score=31.69 TRINITY_DN10077_c0_g2_i1:36-530(-)
MNEQMQTIQSNASERVQRTSFKLDDLSKPQQGQRPIDEELNTTISSAIGVCQIEAEASKCICQEVEETKEEEDPRSKPARPSMFHKILKYSEEFWKTSKGTSNTKVCIKRRIPNRNCPKHSIQVQKEVVVDEGEKGKADLSTQKQEQPVPVSYTHLTLPTIYSV